MFDIMSCDEQWMGILSPLDVRVSCRAELSRMCLCTDKKKIISNWAMCVTDWKCAIRFLCAVDSASGWFNFRQRHRHSIDVRNVAEPMLPVQLYHLVLFQLNNNNNSYNCAVANAEYSLFHFCYEDAAADY